MKRAFIFAALGIACVAALTVACGGGTSNNDRTATAGAGASASKGPATKAAGTPTAAKSGTPSGTGTAARGTAAAPTAGASTPAAQSTLSPADATVGAGVGSGLGGGDPNAPGQVVSTIPAPPPGVTPSVDSTQVADANPPDAQCTSPTAGCGVIVDMDASTPGIQASRTVKVGDIFRVGVVFVKVPPYVNTIGGLNAFNFTLNYDKTKVIAPTISGGSPVDRNPKLNVDALGGPGANWTCLPAPEGDLDDPEGIAGDGDPNTGQAFLSCFTTSASGQAGGNLVVATIEFYAVASGSTTFSLTNLVAADPLGTPSMTCASEPDPTAPVVDCAPGTVTVE